MKLRFMPDRPYESEKKPVETLGPGELSQQPRSLLQLEGPGQEIWRSVDVDDYLRRERSAWNG
jgi:hypothetical protein